MSEYKAQRARFSDAKSNLLQIQTKQMKDGTFQCVAYHTPNNGKQQRGCVGTFINAEEAQKRFASLCDEAQKAKWQRKVRKAATSAFDSIPKAS